MGAYPQPDTSSKTPADDAVVEAAALAHAAIAVEFDFMHACPEGGGGVFLDDMVHAGCPHRKQMRK